MGYEQEVVSYIKDCLCVQHDRSQEYYFGENNTLKVRLLSWIKRVRERIADASKDNPNFLPKDGLSILKQEGKFLSEIICEEFNIEGCTVGWINVINASCYSQIGNSDLYTVSKDAKDLRLKLNDIVDTTNGFKYRNKKGIYYVVSLGYPLIATNDFFTEEEAISILLHELGHGMQHIVNSLNETICMSLYKSLYKTVNDKDELENYSPSQKREIKRMFNRYRNAIKSGNKYEMDKLANGFLDTSKSYQGTSFSKMSQDKIQGYLEEDHHSDWELDQKKYQDSKIANAELKRKSFGNKIKAFFGGIGSLLISPIFIAMSLHYRGKIRSATDMNRYKVFEETADNFCQIYGLGLAQASAMKKLALLDSKLTTKTGGAFERIPLMDLYWSMREIKDDYESALAGYPTDKQRMLNLYRSCKFELQNNKDLPQAYRDELTKQVEEYKKFYDEFVDIDSKKGWYYRIIAGLSRDKLETEAAKDPFLLKQVLIPLQKRMDPKFDPYEEYADVMNDDTVK